MDTVLLRGGPRLRAVELDDGTLLDAYDLLGSDTAAVCASLREARMTEGEAEALVREVARELHLRVKAVRFVEPRAA